jgi:glycosyltransferase involved in cell wall biosynthesis
MLGNVIDFEAMDRLMRPREDLRDIAGVTADDVLVLGVGTLISEKAFARFLRVLEIARATHPGLKGVIIGDGPEMERLQQMTAGSPLLEAGLILAGRRAEAFRLMHGADIFLLTSKSEGAPNVLLEAMGAGLPSVVTSAGDSGTVVTRSASGFVGAHDDERGLAEGLGELAESKDRRDEFGKRARRYAVESCDLRQLWPSMRDIYADIARSAGRSYLAERVAEVGRA